MAMTEARIREFFDAWNRHDVKSIMTFFTAEPTYLASFGPEADGTPFRGLEQVHEGVAAFFATSRTPTTRIFGSSLLMSVAPRSGRSPGRAQTGHTSPIAGATCSSLRATRSG